MALLGLLGCEADPSPAVPEAPARLGSDDMVAQTMAICAFCHAEWRPVDSPPSALEGAPSELHPSIPYIDLGDPLNSAIYLKVTGIHAMLGLPGDVMLPTFGPGLDTVSVGHLGAWIEGRSEPWDLPETLGDPRPFNRLVTERCASCHDGDQALRLDLDELRAIERSEITFRPIIVPGRPWDSGLYRTMVLKHQLPFIPEDDPRIDPDLFDAHALRVVFRLMAPNVPLP